MKEHNFIMDKEQQRVEEFLKPIFSLFGCDDFSVSPQRNTIRVCEWHCPICHRGKDRHTFNLEEHMIVTQILPAFNTNRGNANLNLQIKDKIIKSCPYLKGLEPKPKGRIGF